MTTDNYYTRFLFGQPFICFINYKPHAQIIYAITNNKYLTQLTVPLWFHEVEKQMHWLGGLWFHRQSHNAYFWQATNKNIKHHLAPEREIKFEANKIPLTAFSEYRDWSRYQACICAWLTEARAQRLLNPTRKPLKKIFKINLGFHRLIFMEINARWARKKKNKQILTDVNSAASYQVIVSHQDE